MAIRRPSRRDDFEIGIICALPLEYNAVSLIFDEFWDENGDWHGKVAGDHNQYTTGCIGKYNVVLALLSQMGKTNATSAAHSLRLSYNGLRLVLLVGICGGVPRVGTKEILLGDVVISKTIVQYDFGRRYPDEFLRKDTVEDNLSKRNKEVRNLLATFETGRGIKLLHRRTASFLKELQAIAAKRGESQGEYNYPGTAEDKLFESNYTHGIPRTCECIGCRRTSGCVCDEPFNLSCEEVGCDKRHLVPRERLEKKRQLEPDNIDEAQEPAIYVGPIASGDTVMKSGEDRDRIARKEGVIAFEMEAAGVWEELPCCIVVKGVCDYADSHKSKKWQNFAAATASSVTKVLLERLIREDKPLVPAMRDERADASNMLQNSCLGCNVARLQQGNNITGLPELNLLTILMSQLARGLPPQIKHQEPVTVIDARNRPIPFFLDTIGSVELFTEVLKEKFKDLGLGKIKRGEWYLEDHYTGQILNLTKPWKSLVRPGQLLDMTMIFRRRNISSTQCPVCRSENFGDPERHVKCHMCALTYCRIEEIREISVLEEGSQPQPRTAVPQATPKGEYKVLAPLPRPRPLKPQNDDDDVSRYSRVQIIDTNLQIQKAGESKIIAGIVTLSVQDLDDPERLAAYLATVCSLPEEDCLVALKEWQEVQNQEIAKEKERKKDMQRKRRREKFLQALRATGEEEKERHFRDAQKAEKKAKATSQLLQRGTPNKDIRKVKPADHGERKGYRVVARPAHKRQNTQGSTQGSYHQHSSTYPPVASRLQMGNNVRALYPPSSSGTTASRDQRNGPISATKYPRDMEMSNESPDSDKDRGTNDKMARYEGATHLETIEILTGLRYRDRERSQGISTGDASPLLIRGDLGAFESPAPGDELVNTNVSNAAAVPHHSPGAQADITLFSPHLGTVQIDEGFEGGLSTFDRSTADFTLFDSNPNAGTMSSTGVDWFPDLSQCGGQFEPFYDEQNGVDWFPDLSQCGGQFEPFYNEQNFDDMIWL